MMRFWRYMALVVLALLSLSPAIQPATANTAVYEVGDDPAVGFNLISWWNFGGSGVSTWQNAVQSVYNAGFRSVSISPVRYVDIDTGAILSTSPRGPELSHIEAGVARAKSLGMRVTLNPFVELFDANGSGTSDDEYFADLPGGCTWRGCWNPTPGGAVANQFWSDYQSYLVSVAQIAETYNVDAMTVGTEYKALNGNSGHNAKWNTTINAVAAAYDGPLGYAANWDDYRNGNLTTAIWEHPQIDFLGIDAYFENMVTNAQADASGTYPNNTFINQLTTAWNNKLDVDSPLDSLDGIMLFAAARKGGAGMPVAFTEIGHLPYNRTAVKPQNSSGQPVDTGEQIMAFNGLVNALDRRGNDFHSIDIWHWGMPGTGTDIWDWGLIADVTPNNSGANGNNIPVTQWFNQFVDTAEFPLAGDYNRDGLANAADYTLWRKRVGAHVLNYNGADGDGNGKIGADDYAVWAAHFGASLGGGAMNGENVPEPAAVAPLMISLSCALFRALARRRPTDRAAGWT
jgi:hypothetical protein